MSATHVPVLLEAVVDLLTPAAPGLLVDLTVGLGGHAAALLEAAPGFRLLGLDRDPAAVAEAGARLRRFGDRARLLCRPFAELPRVLAEATDEPPAAILADLGVSSLQLDTAERGFSFAADGPLDMRMGGDGPSAADLVNTASEEELMRILWDFGEERMGRRLARAIVRARAKRPLESTRQLSELVLSVLGPARRGRVHPATRTFQALRIAVNEELAQIESVLEPAARSLRPGGRLAVISFHSLEDRIVKHTLRRLEGRCTCPPDLPRCVCGAETVVRPLTRRALRPGEAEISANPRARSARLRAAERVAEESR